MTVLTLKWPQPINNYYSHWTCMCKDSLAQRRPKCTWVYTLDCHFLFSCGSPVSRNTKLKMLGNLIFKKHSTSTYFNVCFKKLLRAEHEVLAGKEPRDYILPSFSNSVAGSWLNLDSPNESFAEIHLPKGQFSHILKVSVIAVQNTVWISVRKRVASVKDNASVVRVQFATRKQ